MNKPRLKTIIVLLIVSAFIGLAIIYKCACGKSDHLFQKASSNIEQYVQEANIPSISVAVAQNGKIIWEESFGLSNVEEKIKATPHTMYHLGSLGKVYTATAIMLLKERGFIDLDKPANEYLGKVKIEAYEGDANDATIRRILNHTSGLPWMWTHLYENEIDRRPSWDEVIGYYGKIVSPPRDRFIYSNLGFGILGNIIERISGKSYDEFMKSEVFSPLGLTRTMVDTGPSSEEDIAQKYTHQGRVPYFDMICKGGGTVFASAHDLVGFGMFHLKNHLVNQKPVLSDISIDQMQSAIESCSPQSSYRIGWHISRRFGYHIVEHGGHVLGAKAELRLIPSKNIAVAVLSNGDEADTSKINDWIFSELLTRYKFLSGLRNLFSVRGRIGHKTFSPPSSLIGTWSGEIVTYEKRHPVQITIEANGNAQMKYVEKDNPDNTGVAPLKGTSPAFNNSIFTASFPIEIPTSFTQRYPHTAYIDTKLRGTILSGYISAQAWEPQMPHFNVPSYIRLEKMKR